MNKIIQAIIKQFKLTLRHKDLGTTRFEYISYLAFLYTLNIILFFIISYTTNAFPYFSDGDYIIILFFNPIAYITGLILAPVTIPVYIRRCHDIGWSGWMWLVPLMPIFLLFKKGNYINNKYVNAELASQNPGITGNTKIWLFIITLFILSVGVAGYFEEKKIANEKQDFIAIIDKCENEMYIKYPQISHATRDVELVDLISDKSYYKKEFFAVEGNQIALGLPYNLDGTKNAFVMVCSGEYSTDTTELQNIENLIINTIEARCLEKVCTDLIEK